MKRFLPGFLLAIFLLTLLTPINPASALGSIYLTAPQHRMMDGRFVNNELSLLIAPNGELGTALYKQLRSAGDIYIDVALVEEVADLADGYIYLDNSENEVSVEPSIDASRWLAALKSSVTNKRVFALPYGNPDRDFVAKTAPAEYRFYKELAQSRLSGFLGIGVEEADSYQGITNKSSDIAREMHSANRAVLRRIYNAVPAPEVSNLRLELGKLVNPSTSELVVTKLIEPLRNSIDQVEETLRVASGNYTITAAEYGLPVTVINDFSIPVTVKLRVRPNNSRVLVGELLPVSVSAKSQTQVEIPLTVNASGQTDLEIQIRTTARSVGNPVIIPLRLAVISPITTWFTTGMAIILLLAAVVQSVRRVKKRRKS